MKLKEINWKLNLGKCELAKNNISLLGLVCKKGT
jgi:hypothetical protein